jgi:hypothetical protein
LNYRQPKVFDRLVGFLSAQVSFILQPLSIGQQLGIDDITADGLPDLAHGFADRVEECTAGVFHQVPAVGDLVRIRQSSSDRLAVTTTTISGND